MASVFRRNTAWLVLLATLLLAGCDQTAVKEAVPVSGINYTGNDLNSFLFQDVGNAEKVAGGFGLDPFGGGGAMCCISLPRKWRPGIKVKLRYDWWTGSSVDRKFEELTAEIPPYPTGKAAMLWALFYPDGSVEVVASAVDPGHPEWPGKVKHWPVPDREYKLKLWQEEVDRLRRDAEDFESAAASASSKDLLSDWNTWKEYRHDDLADFSGPDDPRFKEAVTSGYAITARALRQRIAELERRSP